jgi:hypothetical protein
MGPLMTVANDPEYWCKRADEALVQMTDPHTEAVMLAIAQDYEKLAVRGRATSWRRIADRMNRRIAAGLVARLPR